MKSKLLIINMLVVLGLSVNAQWQQTNGPYGGCITSLATCDSVIFAGTFTSGVFMSADSGAHWTDMNSGLNNQQYSDQTIYAIAVSESNIFIGTPNAIFRSTNMGSSWAHVAAGIPFISFGVSDSTILAGTYNGVFLSTNNGSNWTFKGLYNDSVHAVAILGNTFFAGTFEGVFISTDSGANWTAANSGLTNSYVYSLATRGTDIYAGTKNGIYYSTNNGISWNAINTGMANLKVFTIKILGSDIYAGTNNGAYLSTDNGVSWNEIDTGLTISNVNSIAFLGNNVFAGTDGAGVFRSTNSGANWFQVNQGLAATNVNSIAFLGNTIFAGAKQGGLFSSTNNGASWTFVNTGMTNSYYISDIAISGNNIFIGTNKGILMSSDSGANWIPKGLANKPITCIAISDSNIYVGSVFSIYLSTDLGNSWSQINNGITPPCIINDIAISGNNIYAGTFPAGVFLSTNNGANWTQMNNGLTNTHVNSLTASGNNIFAGTAWGDVFVSTDNCVSWLSVHSDLNQDIVSSIIINNDTVFFAYNYNIFYSTNNGVVWSSINSNFLNSSSYINALAVNSDYLYACTSHKVWMKQLSSLNGGDCSAQFTLIPDSTIQHHYFIINNATGVLPLKYLWSWGDGTHDTIAYPSHTYSAAGYYTISLSIIDSTECSSTYTYTDSLQKSSNTIIYIDVIPSGGTGINETINNNSFSVYPNPVINDLTIETSQKSEIEISNIEGQIIKRLKTKDNKTVIDISDFSSGVYIIRLKTDKGITTGKFIKE